MSTNHIQRLAVQSRRSNLKVIPLSSAFVVESGATNPPGEVVYRPSVPPYNYETYYGETTKSESGDRSKWKSFQHYKRWLGPIKPMVLELPVQSRLFVNDGVFPQYVRFSDPYDLDMGEFGDPGTSYGLPEFYTSGSETDLISPPDKLDELIAMSYRTMSPNIKTELMLLNSIYELKDFETLPRSIRLYKKAALVLVKKNLLSPHANLRTLLRSMADGYLQTQFNIMPLISDVQGVITVLQQIERRISAAMSASGRVTTKHFMYSWQELPQFQIGNFNKVDGGAVDRDFSEAHILSTRCFSTTSTVTKEVSPSEFRAHMQFTYRYTAGQLEHKRILGLLDGLGVNVNPAIIWNAIPWSFVVDWLLGVSQWLSRQKVGLLDPTIELHQYCWSIKRFRKTNFDVRISDIWSVNGEPPHSPCSISRPTVYETAYRRSAGIPSISSLTTSGLSPKELSLAGALAYSKTRRSVKPKAISPVLLYLRRPRRFYKKIMADVLNK